MKFNEVEISQRSSNLMATPLATKDGQLCDVVAYNQALYDYIVRKHNAYEDNDECYQKLILLLTEFEPNTLQQILNKKKLLQTEAVTEDNINAIILLLSSFLQASAIIKKVKGL